MIHLVYFARLRESLGAGQEAIEIPPEVKTVGDMRAWLARRGENWHRELAASPNTHVAINQEYACNDSLICDGDEVAFFPPVTGG